MNLFEWLLIGHLVGDYVFQTRWMALNKSQKLLPLFLHSFVYTLIVYIFSLPAEDLTISDLLIIFISHLILDQRQIVQWWVKNINNSAEISWLQIMVDQVFHLLILVLVIYL